MAYQIDSQMRLGAKLPEYDVQTIKNEPMLFSCDLLNAWDKGGIITKNFLKAFFGDNLPLDSNAYCVDTRVHMLMPGWWPCIPGWHHDDVPRSRVDGQPNYETPEYSSKHCLALAGGKICPTEFAIGQVEMPHVEGTVYKEWHPLVEDKIFRGELMRTSAPDNQLIFFNNHTFHQGSRCIENGWRWFGRISWDAGYEQGRPHFNEIRRQVNVYMEHPMEGW